MGEDNNTNTSEPKESTGVQFEGKGTVVIENCNWGDNHFSVKGEVDAAIVDTRASNSVELEGNSAHVDGLEISGSGKSAFKLSNTQADIFNLIINPGYRYGLDAQDSVFSMFNSRLQGDKYDVRFHSGVVADMYNVEAEDLLDLARGGELRAIQNGILDEIVSTTDRQLQLEQIAIRSKQLIELISAFFLIENVYSWLQ